MYYAILERIYNLIEPKLFFILGAPKKILIVFKFQNVCFLGGIFSIKYIFIPCVVGFYWKDFLPISSMRSTIMKKYKF